ncbi:hypothetical protein MMC27_001848 [Xylographa pallens]|nr:hypothetical protein [Xylographa pallens]
MLHLDFSGCTSRSEILCARSLEVEVIGTPTSENEKQARHSTFKVKLEDVVKDDFLSVSSTIGATTLEKTQSWSTKQWNTVSFFDSDLPLAPVRRARIFNGDVPVCKQSKSCESDPHTPSRKSISSKILYRVPSRSTLDVPLHTKHARDQLTVTVDEIDEPESPVKSPESPVSSESDSSDDENPLFDTPQPKSHESHDLSTPLTPPSVYKPRGSFLGDDSPSPAERKSRRPAPRRFPHLGHKSKIHFSGCSIRQKEDQDVDSSGVTSTKSRSFDEDPTEGKTAAVDVEEEEDEEEIEEREGGDAAVETKLNNIKIEDDIVEHETCSDAPIITAAMKEASSSMKVIDVIRQIFGDEISTLIKEKRNRCYGFKKKDLHEEGPRCMRRVAEAKIERACKRLHEAHKPLPLPDLTQELHGIIELLFCYDHLGIATTKTVSWVHSQGVSSPARKAYGHEASVGVELPKIYRKEAIQTAAISDYTFSQLSSSTSTRTHIESEVQYVSWQPTVTENHGVEQALAWWAVTPLRKRDQWSGQLYVYVASEGEREYRKIGATIKTPEIRLNRCRKDCRLDVKLVYPEKNEDLVPIEHVFRLERFVHTELKDYRLKKFRCRCNKNHQEWSQAPHALIVAVIRKWTAWLQLEPYEKVGAYWQLKSGFHNLEDVCTPCSVLSVAGPSLSSTLDLSETSTTRILRSQDFQKLKVECGQSGVAA